MTKYLVSGYIGFDNFGDEAIAKALVEKILSGNFDDEYGIVSSDNEEKFITLISSNPEKTSSLYCVDSCKMLEFFKPLINSDVLISGGGSLLQDVTSKKSLFYYLGIIYLGIILRKKVVIFSQGIGPINSTIGKFLTKFALKNCYKISVRDEKSLNLLNNWHINASLVKDPILEIDLPNKQQKGIVGIQLRRFPTLSDKFLTSLADEIVKNFSDKRIEIYSFQDSIDLSVCEDFKRLLNKKGLVNVEVYRNLSINEVFDKISMLEYLIAMRFHANVVGIKAGVKTLAIDYDIKVKKLAEEFHLPLLELTEYDFSKQFDELIKQGITPANI